MLPWNNGWPDKERAIRELNALIHALGVPVLPFHDTLEDPERPGRMKAEWTKRTATIRRSTATAGSASSRSASVALDHAMALRHLSAARGIAKSFGSR